MSQVEQKDTKAANKIEDEGEVISSGDIAVNMDSVPELTWRYIQLMPKGVEFLLQKHPKDDPLHLQKIPEPDLNNRSDGVGVEFLGLCSMLDDVVKELSTEDVKYDALNKGVFTIYANNEVQDYIMLTTINGVTGFYRCLPYVDLDA